MKKRSWKGVKKYPNLSGVEYDFPRCAVDDIGKSVGTINRRLNSHKYPEYIRKGIS